MAESEEERSKAAEKGHEDKGKKDAPKKEEEKKK